MATAITATGYTTLDAAYDYFNQALLVGSLPSVLITLQRHPKMRGYFRSDSFKTAPQPGPELRQRTVPARSLRQR
jgi:hypothetical protein